MIQYISYYKKDISNKNFESNTLDKPMSFDNYEVNIIDLNNESIWRNNQSNITHLNCQNDLKNLKIMIKKSKKTKIFVIFPQNYYYRYGTNFAGGYKYQCELKNNLSALITLLDYCIDVGYLTLVYERNRTLIIDEELSSDFYFDSNLPSGSSAIKRSTSEKITMIKKSNIVFTTLDYNNNYDNLLLTLKELNFLKNNEDSPSWFAYFRSLDDEKLIKEEEALNKKFVEIKENIEEVTNKLRLNNKYKSIVYTTGTELVEVVFMLLEKVLGIDLSSFTDKYSEDFNFIKNDMYYVGEIKGVNENVKNSHLSQLDNHVQSYVEENNLDENMVKGILIINPLRKTELSSRTEINEAQIKKAINRYGFLIIRTEDLLKLYSMFLNNEINQEEIIEIIKNQSGLISIQ